MAPLTDVVISPENIALEAQREASKTLSKRQQRQIRKAIALLEPELAPIDTEGTYAIFEQLVEDLHVLKARMQYIRLKIEESPTPELYATAASIREQALALEPKYRQLKPVAERIAELKSLKLLLEQHELALAYERAKKEQMEAMRRESLIYERLLVDAMAAMGFCHRYEVGGRTRVDKVKFAKIIISVDTIHYLIEGSRKTMFKGYIPRLPNGVVVAKIVEDEHALMNLSIACTRQVTGKYMPTGQAWLIVNRTNAPDGLMNHVSWQAVMSRYPLKHRAKFPICVGVSVNRQVQWVNMAQFHHWMISGFTGSGKSNMLNVLLSTLISQHSPEDVRLMFIDLKRGVELTPYENVPHRLGPIITRVDDVVTGLAQLEALMEHRYDRFSGAGVKNLETFNQRHPDETFPRIVCVFDEVAELQGFGPTTKRIHQMLASLVRLGRGAGIHVVLVTQRPDVEVIPGQIKANLVVKLVGAATSASDSIAAMGKGAARDLPVIPGRMFFSLGPKPLPVQTPLIEEDTIKAMVDKAMQWPTPPEITLPQIGRKVDQIWTVEKIIDLAMTHLDGNISADAVWKATKEDLSQNQARELVLQVWEMNPVMYQGQAYKVKKAGRGRVLVPIAAPEADLAGD
ncbi:MAG: DNA translocase FtsK [Anaerolineae bacterium]|nr:DNA translocase FtsK [Anaerolineae bacterium]